MNTTAQPGYQDPRASLAGALLFVTFLAFFVVVVSLPRTPIGERDSLRVLHDSLGLLLSVLAAWRLLLMWRAPRPQPPPGLPAASFAFNRAILIALLLCFIAETPIGIAFGWGEFDREVVLFGWQLPNPWPDNDGLRKAAGYLHSALGFYYLFLIGLWLVYGLYQQLRYRAGLLRLLPGPRV